MLRYCWCEDSKSGYLFWKELFKTVYPDIIVESKNSNSGLNKAADRISSNDGNLYYIIVDNAIDNPDVLREMLRLKKCIAGKTNVKIISIHSFEFVLLSFEQLEKWVFAENDELKDKRSVILEARSQFVKLVNAGGYAEDLNKFKSVYINQSKHNSEKISAKLLFEITRNTGFETNKSHIGSCFVNSCCEWDDRQENDICGLDDRKLILYEKMKQIIEHSVLQAEFTKVGL